uniref:Uncharacterized protein n=1 Tax=Pectobacterium versatile TaxID=2488639 RepID=A0A855MG45_9GAMM|nr:hypothetical protein F131LOC_01864 [Pectobacterium versatile]
MALVQLFPWRFAAHQLVNASLALCGDRRIQLGQEFVKLFVVQNKQTLIQQDVLRLATGGFKHKIGT